MAALLTEAEVISNAFTRSQNLAIKIPDNILEPVQDKHIRPILGDDFYEAVVAAPSGYTDLVAFIKPVIAYFVKFYVLKDIAIDISTSGLNKIIGNNRQAGQAGDLGTVEQHALEMADVHSQRLTQYLNDNEDSFPLYYKWSNARNRITTAGGIIFDRPNIDEVDDYTINL